MLLFFPSCPFATQLLPKFRLSFCHAYEVFHAFSPCGFESRLIHMQLQRPLGPVPDVNVLFCYLGTFKGLGDDTCKPCEPEEYQLQQGQESCDLCPENHYCPVSLLWLLWQLGLTSTANTLLIKANFSSACFLFFNTGRALVEQWGCN